MHNEDVLISVQQRYFDRIASGIKTVELRRREPQIATGSRIWLYCKSPIATIAAACSLKRVDTLGVDDLWDRYGEQAALSRYEFDDYLAERRTGTALVLEDVRMLPVPVNLDLARDLRGNFQPPQFFMRLQSECSLREYLVHSLT